MWIRTEYGLLMHVEDGRAEFEYFYPNDDLCSRSLWLVVELPGRLRRRRKYPRWAAEHLFWLNVYRFQYLVDLKGETAAFWTIWKRTRFLRKLLRLASAMYEAPIVKPPGLLYLVKYVEYYGLHPAYLVYTRHPFLTARRLEKMAGR